MRAASGRSRCTRRRAARPAGRCRRNRGRRLAHELAEEPARDLLEEAAAAAARAGDDSRAGRRAAALARAAGHGGLERNPDGRPLRGLDELDRHLGDDVAAAGGAAPASAPEQVVAEEGAEEVAEGAEVEVGRLEAAGAEPGVAVAVVELARLRVRERLVGLRDLAEAHLGLRMVGDVRMQLAREPAERLLDRLLVGVSRDAEQLVVVAFGRGHRALIVPGRLELAAVAAATRRRRPPRRTARARRPPSARCGAPSRSPSAAARAG